MPTCIQTTAVPDESTPASIHIITYSCRMGQTLRINSQVKKKKKSEGLVEKKSQTGPQQDSAMRNGERRYCQRQELPQNPDTFIEILERITPRIKKLTTNYNQSKCPQGMKMLNLLRNYAVCGRHLEFMLKNMFKVKIISRNKIPMAELVKIDLLFVKIAPQMKKFCSTETDGGHF